LITDGDIQRSWNCPRCNEELGELNAVCEFCKIDNVIVYNPDKYFIREIRIHHLIHASETSMTPQEQLFKDLFNHEKLLVKDMDILTLRAHREELSKYAFEARARLTAVDDEEQGRKKKTEHEVRGFERSLNTDEITTNAINAIKDRQKRLTKQEKIQASLEKLGISTVDAEKLMSAGTILGRINRIKSQASPVEEQKQTENKPIFNPFEKKES
jgi:hypothetical protein